MAQESIPSPSSGVYAVCRTDARAAKDEKIWYIGKTQDFSKRVKGHLGSWSHVLMPSEIGKLVVSFGIINSLEDSPSDPKEIRSNVESLLRFRIKPLGNKPSTYERYTGKRPIFIANIGPLAPIDKFMTSLHDLDDLINKKPPVKKHPKGRRPTRPLQAFIKEMEKGL